MKKLISVLILVAIMASFCTVSAFAATGEELVYTEAELRAALLDSSITTITLEGPITVNAEGGNNFALEIKRPVTINGNGKTINSSAGRVINIETTGEVNIKNLTISGGGERGINIINETVTVNLTGVTISANNYAVMLATSSASSTLSISGGSYTGANTINIAGPNSVVNISGAILTTNDNNPGEGYGTVSLFTTAGGTKVTLSGNKLAYNHADGDKTVSSNFVNGTSDSLESVLIDDGTNEYKNAPSAANMTAVIDYNNGYSYLFDSVSEALNIADSGETIKMLRDVDLGEEIITIDKNVTIDMNNKKITNGAFKLADGVTVTVENYSGTEAELKQLLSGKLPVANPYGVPSTADNSNMPLWTILFVGFAAVALLTGKKRRA